MATEIIAKNETVINKNHVLKLAFFYSSANIKSAMGERGGGNTQHLQNCCLGAHQALLPASGE